MKIAFYGGSFDPVHKGHLAIGEKLLAIFGLDAFVYVPAFHAPHKPERKPTSAYHRFTMLALATKSQSKLKVSQIELELPEKPYTIETLTKLKAQLPNDEIFFVMGADSWQDILTWREWESVLLLTNHIVVTRPGYDLSFEHVTDSVRERIRDVRGSGKIVPSEELTIYFTDAVQMNLSATEIRKNFYDKSKDTEDDVAKDVATYIKKYELYK